MVSVQGKSQKKIKTAKNRLDEDVVKRGLAPSLEKARAFIMAGEILVKGQVVYKADTMVKPEYPVEMKEKYPYASRGAAKIEKPFAEFAIVVKGMKVVDIGISTGGFTDYMLQNGAEAVVGVDVNIRQVDDRLKKEPRLLLIEKNARFLEVGDISFEPDLITMDVSFISVTKILPALSVFKKARILTLIKPQFEARREDVEKGGVIREKEKRIEILLELKKKIQELNYAVTGFTSAGIKGRKGNREYFFLLEYGKKVSISDTIITHADDI
ncbi:MAG: rRNA (cytidine1920-2-O)/16S rRNA (cytidine1409-2-O)-methyltransferase [Acidobacteriota bacterium]|nr:rRNA (cytidine1920-2-O)/16S rRNA (cytidine1409-2-O)-methyltransferase [Acidobacteriota bacterium]